MTCYTVPFNRNTLRLPRANDKYVAYSGRTVRSINLGITSLVVVFFPLVSVNGHKLRLPCASDEFVHRPYSAVYQSKTDATSFPGILLSISIISVQHNLDTQQSKADGSLHCFSPERHRGLLARIQSTQNGPTVQPVNQRTLFPQVFSRLHQSSTPSRVSVHFSQGPPIVFYSVSFNINKSRSTRTSDEFVQRRNSAANESRADVPDFPWHSVIYHQHHRPMQFGTDYPRRQNRMSL